MPLDRPPGAPLQCSTLATRSPWDEASAHFARVRRCPRRTGRRADCPHRIQLVAAHPCPERGAEGVVRPGREDQRRQDPLQHPAARRGRAHEHARCGEERAGGRLLHRARLHARSLRADADGRAPLPGRRLGAGFRGLQPGRHEAPAVHAGAPGRARAGLLHPWPRHRVQHQAAGHPAGGPAGPPSGRWTAAWPTRSPGRWA